MYIIACTIKKKMYKNVRVDPSFRFPARCASRPRVVASAASRRVSTSYRRTGASGRRRRTAIAFPVTRFFFLLFFSL